MTTEASTLLWRVSSYSGDNGNCVQLAALPDDQVAVRNSRLPDAGTLVFTRAEMLAWIRGARAGEFDDLT